MDNIRTANLGNFDRQLVSYSGIFNDWLIDTGWLFGRMFINVAIVQTNPSDLIFEKSQLKSDEAALFILFIIPSLSFTTLFTNFQSQKKTFIFRRKISQLFRTIIYLSR
jgi:hypothetical protein